MITNFDHKGTDVVNVILELKVGVLKHLIITHRLEICVRIKYIERILKGAEIKEFIYILVS